MARGGARRAQDARLTSDGDAQCPCSRSEAGKRANVTVTNAAGIAEGASPIQKTSTWADRIVELQTDNRRTDGQTAAGHFLAPGGVCLAKESRV